MLESTNPPTYSEIERGVAKMFRKFLDHTSSMNAIVTPCITRVKKSHSKTAPRNTGTKSNFAALTEFKYLVMNPQRTMSIATHANSGSTRAGLPLTRYK